MRNLIISFLLSFLLLSYLMGCDTYVDRTIALSTEPTGATVLLNGTKLNGTTPMIIDKVRWYEPVVNRPSSASRSSSNSIELRFRDYEKKVINLNYESAKKQPNRAKWVLPKITLGRISHVVRTRINSSPSGAEVIISGKTIGRTPLAASIRFNRKSAKESWNPIAVMIKKNGYLSVHKDISYSDALLSSINVPIYKIEQSFSLDIKSNIPDSVVKVNDELIGKPPLRHTFQFSRKDELSPWNSFVITVSKDGYHGRSKDGAAKPGDFRPWKRVVTVNDASSGTISAELEKNRFGRSILRHWVFDGEGFSVAEDIVWAQIGEIEPEPQIKSVTNITDEPAGKLMLSNISVAKISEKDKKISSSKYQIIYTKSIDLVGGNRTFSNLRRIIGQGTTSVTDGNTIDIDAVITPDSEYIYFSANRTREGKFNLWRIKSNGKSGFTTITDSPSSVADIEPAISPDGSMIAFTRWLEGADLPQIWIKPVKGMLATQLRSGHSPVWSPDGKGIAYVAPDKQGNNQIWVMNMDGSSPTKISRSACDHQYPCWTPDGKKIVYASNDAKTTEGIRNWDIWMMNRDGTENTRLTTFGSYDTQPEVSDDGRYIYFFSNRNAKREFDNNWQIWRIEFVSNDQ